MKKKISSTLINAIANNSYPKKKLKDIDDDGLRYLVRGNYPPKKTTEIRDEELKGFSLVVWKTGVMSFCVRYRNTEGRWRKFTLGKVGTLTPTQARKLAVVKLGEVKAGVDVHKVKKEIRAVGELERSRTLVGFFNNQYRPYCESRMKSAGQVQYIQKFVDGWPNSSLTDMTTFRLQRWRADQKKLGKKNGAVNRPVSALKAMLNKAVEWNFLDSNPLQTIKPLSEDKSPVVRYLSKDEECSLREAMNAREQRQVEERDRYRGWQKSRKITALPSKRKDKFTDYLKPLVLTALNTGMRRGELFGLRVGDLDLHSGAVTVTEENSKSGNTRSIPLANEGLTVLGDWCSQNQFIPGDLIFPSPVTGGRLDNINKSWRKLIKDAGIDKFRFHDLRHTYASKLVMQGAPLYDVKQLLGHASVNTTQRYAHLSPDHLSNTVNLLDEVTP